MGDTVAFDTETKGLRWFDPAEQAFLVSWTEGDTSHVAHVNDAEGMAQFRRAIDGADTLVAHNLSFDVHQVRESLGVDLLTTGHKLIDTDHLARVALPERVGKAKSEEDDTTGYKLKALAKTYLRADAQAAEDRIMELAKSIGVKLKGENATPAGYWEVWRAYPQEMEAYALLDAEYARDLLPILTKKLPDRAANVWDLERRVAPTIIRAEQHGVGVDPEKVADLKAEYEPMAERLHDAVTSELGDIKLDGKGSHDALLEALLSHGVPLTERTETGQIATHKFALMKHADAFPVINNLLEWRVASKFLSTYIGPMEGRTTVHTSFWQIGAWTGRMSCSRPNMQNLPARGEAGATKVREVFVPRPGMCFVVADYDSIEIRVLAHFLNDEWYKALLRDGGDPHSWMASKIWGGEPEEYAKGTDGEKLRGLAKNILFAIVYGAGAPRVANMLADAGMPSSRETARDLILSIKNALPRYHFLAGTRRPKGRIPTKIERDGFVTTLFGRKQVVKREKAYVGLNSLIQGSAADIFKEGAAAVDAVVQELGARPVLFVHDEIVVEAPVEYADEVLTKTIAAMRGAYTLDPPLEVTGSIAYGNYSEGK